MSKYFKRIAHVSFKCNDFEKMCSFYRDTMGFEQIFTLPYEGAILDAHRHEGFREGDTWIAYFKINDRQFVELFNTPYEAKYSIPSYSFMHFSVLVEDIIAAARHFENKGVQLWAGPKHVKKPYTAPYPGDRRGQCNSYAFYIQDPEGNEIEVMQFTEDSLQLNWRKNS
ncbi:VOC family protein [Feifania hominis]|uniref:VOC family protein n=1 Tax=Feifania hominis TaxID=2763660 RepID=A0A926DDV1_9FIRM|nr:VOC family protein [Feifania hominis]MBC8537145.1 VOC family protein [Feifania hominis]